MVCGLGTGDLRRWTALVIASTHAPKANRPTGEGRAVRQSSRSAYFTLERRRSIHEDGLIYGRDRDQLFLPSFSTLFGEQLADPQRLGFAIAFHQAEHLQGPGDVPPVDRVAVFPFCHHCLLPSSFRAYKKPRLFATGGAMPNSDPKRALASSTN